MMLATDLAVLDHADGSVLLVANAVNYDATDERVEDAWADAVARLDAMTSDLAAARAEHGGDRRRRASTRPGRGARATTPRRDFEAMVEQAKEAIRAGEVFQVVLSQRFSTPCRGRRPRRLPRAALVQPQPLHVPPAPARRPTARPTTSSAPRPRRSSRSPGGAPSPTRSPARGPRGKTPEDDPRLAEDLLADAKERAEHVMLVDLGRNDLQRVCAAGHASTSSSS